MKLLATDKQKKYLLNLVETYCEIGTGEEREEYRRYANKASLTKIQASRFIRHLRDYQSYLHSNISYSEAMSWGEDLDKDWKSLKRYIDGNEN